MYTLLVADDEKIERDAISLMISRAHLPIKVIQARNGKDAIKLFTIDRPSFVFLDIKMPGIGGLEAGAEIKKIDPHVPIVYLTAWSSFDYAKEAISIGAIEYLVKPAQKEDIYAVLTKLMKIVDQREAEKKERENEIRLVIKQFSRPFFVDLKYGKVSKENLLSYFNLKTTHIENLAFIIENAKEQSVSEFFKSFQSAGLQLFYFDGNDRLIIIAFPKHIENFIRKIERYALMNHTFAGVGHVVEDITLMHQSIEEASRAFNIAKKEGNPMHRYQMSDSTYFKGTNRTQLISDIVDNIIHDNLTTARFKAHELTDSFNHAEVQDYYAAQLIIRHELYTKIPYLPSQIIKPTSFGEIETLLFDFLDLCSDAVKRDKKDRYERAFAMVESKIRNQYQSIISVEDISKLLNINEKYFSKLFKQYLGCGFVEFLTKVKMEHAAEFLAQGKSVKEVAELTGYNDATYFSRVFHQYFGVTPSKYLNK